MLPILIVMDVVGLWAYRGNVQPREPAPAARAAASLGVALGALTFRYIDDSMLRVGIGAFAIALRARTGCSGARAAPPAPRSRAQGPLLVTVAGFTSTLVHAGGPPLNVYLLPLRLDKAVFVGTTVVFFAVINVGEARALRLAGALRRGATSSPRRCWPRWRPWGSSPGSG